MKRNASRLLVIVMCAVIPVHAADDPKQRKDLAAVIALQGLPCGEVVAYEVKGDNDYVAACKDGNRYRVFVNAGGRVVVQKQ
jgi:2-keto-3-deoxy-6-phosphogluconate aldolase